MTALNLVYVLAFIDFIGVNASRVVLQLFSLELHASPTEVGLLIALYYVCPLLLSWPAGLLSDRYGPRRPLLFSAVCGSLGMVIPYYMHTLPALYVAGMLSGMSFAFFLVIVQNLVGVLSAPEKRATAFSNFSLFGATSNFIGPLVAGLSVDHLDYPISCLVAGVFTLMCGIMVLIYGRVLPEGSRRRAPRAPIRDTLADPAVMRILAIGALVQLGTDLFQFYIPVYGVGIGLSASAIGALLSVFAVASFIIRFTLPHLVKRWGEAKLLAYSFYLAALGFALVPLFTSGLMLALVSFIFGLGTGCGQPIATMLMFSRAADGRSGEALGLRLTVNNLVRVIAPATFGFIVSAFGLPPVFYINALMMGAGGLVSRAGKSKR